MRVLRYFLTVAREASFSRAADALYMSQPTLSRQIRDLEEELGAPLFVRTNRNVTLTREGMRLRRRAQEIVDLVDRTRAEFENPDEEIAGDVCIGSGETHAMRALARVAIDVRREHPGIRYNLYSGNADDVIERLDKGLLDFGVVIDPADVRKYDCLRIPGSDVVGAADAGRTTRCAQKASIAPEDLEGVPLLVSRQSMARRRPRAVAGPGARAAGNRRDVQPRVQRGDHGRTGHGLRAGAGPSGRRDGRRRAALPPAFAEGRGRPEARLEKVSGVFAGRGGVSARRSCGVLSAEAAVRTILA